MNLENFIESKYREISEEINLEYKNLYAQFNNEKLECIFSTIHSKFVSCYTEMNSRLPTGDEGAHYWAEESRMLLGAIEMLKELRDEMINTKCAFSFDEYYEGIINFSETFLKKSGGSTIPANMKKVIIYYTIPIIRTILNFKEDISGSKHYHNLKLIGEGSYAKVYTFESKLFGKKLALKRAKKDLNSKELKRFKQEFDEMKKLSSPYILEVYSYNNNEYVMEYAEDTLENYIQKNNNQLQFSDRKKVGFQVLRAFKYIDSKEILHRDISPNNILIKVYEDTKIVKLADFGLLKKANSNLTSVSTEFKGSFNDPILMTEGFANYNILHETYALTKLLYFVLTGKRNVSDIKNPKLKKFIEKGTNPDVSKRYTTIDEITEAFKVLEEGNFHVGK